jgi:hypothetical protein
VGRYDDALRELTALNTTAVAHYNLAHLLEQKNQRQLAVQHLQQAVALDSSLIPAQDMLAQLKGSVSTAVAAQPAIRPSTAFAPAASPSRAAASALVPEAAEPPSYHVGDDSSAAASLAQRPNWSGTASSSGGARPLPPIE